MTNCTNIAITGQAYDLCPHMKICGTRKFCTYTMQYEMPAAKHYHYINIYDEYDNLLNTLKIAHTDIGVSWLFDGGCIKLIKYSLCLLYTSPSPRDGLLSRMPSSA